MEVALISLCTLTTIVICIVAAYNIYRVGKDIKITRNNLREFEHDLFELHLAKNPTDKEYTLRIDDKEHEKCQCDSCWFYFMNPLDGSDHCSRYSGLPLSDAVDKCDEFK